MLTCAGSWLQANSLMNSCNAGADLYVVSMCQGQRRKTMLQNVVWLCVTRS